MPITILCCLCKYLWLFVAIDLILEPTCNIGLLTTGFLVSIVDDILHVLTVRFLLLPF